MLFGIDVSLSPIPVLPADSYSLSILSLLRVIADKSSPSSESSVVKLAAESSLIEFTHTRSMRGHREAGRVKQDTDEVKRCGTSFCRYRRFHHCPTDEGGASYRHGLHLWVHVSVKDRRLNMAGDSALLQLR